MIVATMRRHYSVADAKNRLPAVLREAEAGEPIEITRHGKPVAVVLSIDAWRRLQAPRADLWAAYEAWRAGGPALTDADVEALADSSRDADPTQGVRW